MTFRRQVVVTFGGVVAVVFVAALLSLGRLGAVDSVRDELGGRTAPYASALAAAATDMKGMANDERGYLMTGDEKFLGEIADGGKKIAGELDAAREVAAPTSDARAAADTIETGFTTWTKALEGEFARFKTDKQGAIALALGSNRDLRKAYEENVKAATAKADEQPAAELVEVGRNTHDTRVALIVLALLALAGAFWFELRTRRRLAPLVAQLRSLDEHCEIERIATDAHRAEADVAEVASVAEQSSASAEQVSASTQQTSASEHEIAASASSLATTADELDALVPRFTVA